MSGNLQYIHISLSTILPHVTERKLVLLTGARQTGKTTQAKKLIPIYTILTLIHPKYACV
jgi:Cdc6-like AAA superfamily ATPase